MKRIFFTVLAALLVLVSCKEETVDPNNPVIKSEGQIYTIEEAKTYLARQLEGNNVLVKSIVSLTDKTPGGWRVEFTGGYPATIDLMNGTDDVNGLTPKLVVRHNADGSTTLWVEEEDKLVETRYDLTGPVEAPITPGESGIPPKLDVRRGGDGTLSVWYNDEYNYPDDGWKNTGVKINSGSGTGSETEAGAILAVIDNEARGAIAIWLNDKDHTSYTFEKFSPAVRFNVMSDDVNMSEGETSKLLLLVSSSEAWIPTGVGEWIDRWELNDPELPTRAGYVQPCPYSKIESIFPSGRGQGEYIVTLRNLTSNLNTVGMSDIHALALNTNTEKIPKIVTSTRFNINSRLPSSANSIVVKPNSTVDISMAQVIKEFQMGFVSATRIANTDNVTADWVWADKPGTLTGTGIVSAIDVLTPSNSGLNTKIKVTTGPTEGNVVVAAKVNGAIVWSWHIWVTNYDPETDNLLYQSTGETRLSAPDAGKPHTFMDRNLGALSDTYVPGSDDVFGLYYQWGRKDPIIGNQNDRRGGDPSTLPKIYTPSAPAGTNITLVNPSMTAGIRYSIEHPDVFISTTSSLTGFWSWNDMSVQSLADLWYDGTDVSFNVTKSVYDPCPAGWRLPSKGVLEGSTPNEDPATVIANRGYSGTPYGFIPLAGYVDYIGSVVPDVARFAFYTSQKDIPIWFSEWANGTRYETTGGSQLSKYGSNTYSVRCIKED
ncbi:MAG: fibrobacter succinogenes major paralogous domain-containing protein [Bacteroidales bacterium]|jgi:hypothetical protein|nr:fibrobacter succinogenes major paralogous domain-containing protein [Bacteroidales bacterium]